MIRKRLLILAVLMAVLTGCADNRPLNYRALVLTLGVAPAAHGRVTVYFQIPTPRGLKGLSASSGTGSASSQSTTYTVAGTGLTVARAFNQAQSAVDQDLYLGQLQAVIFSTHLSAAQFEGVLSMLTRTGSLDKTAYALATAAPISAVLGATPPTAIVSPLYYSTDFGCARCQTVNLKRTIWNMEEAHYAPARSLWLPLVQPMGEGLRIDRIVLYRGQQAGRILTPHETMLLGYVLGRTGKGTVQLRRYGLAVSVHTLRALPRFNLRWGGSQLHLTVQLRLIGAVDAFPLSADLKSHLGWVEQATSARVATQTLTLLTQLGKAGIDPLAWGNAYLWRHPGEEQRWKVAYRQATWTVRVSTDIREIGDST
ncbi:MAG: hypothetical protein M0Z36_10090 [Thermaerobacter sp.]|nr:hypothetical protein [Thermaerobacter sp.]